MNVLLDAHMLGEQEGGNETYVAGLLTGFESLGADLPVSLTVLLKPGYQPPKPLHPSIRSAWLSTNNNFRRLLQEVPAQCRMHHANLLHATYNASPFLSCGLVVNVHDVIYRLYPHYFSPRVRLLLSTFLPLTMLRAKTIITLSDISRRDIERFYPFARNKIRVVPAAAGPVIHVQPDEVAAHSITGNKPFVLAVGTLQPRKNLARLLEAYIRARTAGTIDARLVIVGRAAWQHSQLFAAVSQSPYSEDIIFPGYLDDPVVAALYRTCAVFAYPSLYEGFGLPVLEAMACQAPVITTRATSMAELAGGAALLVDAESVDQLQHALESVLNNAPLADDLRVKGTERARQFSWRQVAETTVDIYRRAALTR